MGSQEKYRSFFKTLLLIFYTDPHLQTQSSQYVCTLNTFPHDT